MYIFALSPLRSVQIIINEVNEPISTTSSSSCTRSLGPKPFKNNPQSGAVSAQPLTKLIEKGGPCNKHWLAFDNCSNIFNSLTLPLLSHGALALWNYRENFRYRFNIQFLIGFNSILAYNFEIPHFTREPADF